MLKIRLLYAVLFFLIAAFSVFAQEDAKKPREEIFVAPLIETLLYGYDGLAFGGGIAAGYGTRSVLGTRFLYAADADDFLFMELQLLLRFYFFDEEVNKGPFVQVNGGPVWFFLEKPKHSGHGALSIGLSAGWRFLFGKMFYAEPVLRVGYPYLIGGGATAGVRF